MLVGLRRSTTFIPVIGFYPSSSLALETEKKERKKKKETKPFSSHSKTESLVRQHISVTEVMAWSLH